VAVQVRITEILCAILQVIKANRAMAELACSITVQKERPKTTPYSGVIINHSYRVSK